MNPLTRQERLARRLRTSHQSWALMRPMKVGVLASSWLDMAIISGMISN